MTKVAIMIDGGYLRVIVRKAGHTYDPQYIETIAHACSLHNEEILRILYYDCAPYNGVAKLPISGNKKEFNGSDTWLCKLAEKDLFAVRRGVLKFRGFKLKKVPVHKDCPTDDDFKPDFEQKGVDMRIGLDVATFSVSQAVNRIILISSDTDCIPAMKHGRKAGLQIVLVKFPDSICPPEMRQHADFIRAVQWPDDAERNKLGRS